MIQYFGAFLGTNCESHLSCLFTGSKNDHLLENHRQPLLSSHYTLKPRKNVQKLRLSRVQTLIIRIYFIWVMKTDSEHWFSCIWNLNFDWSAWSALESLSRSIAPTLSIFKTERVGPPWYAALSKISLSLQF